MTKSLKLKPRSPPDPEDVATDPEEDVATDPEDVATDPEEDVAPVHPKGWKPLEGISAKAKKLYEDSQLPGAPAPLYTCIVCKAAYNGKSSENEHKTKHNNALKGKGVERTFQCPHCEIGPYATNKQLQKHIKDKHGESKSRIKCTNCGLSYEHMSGFLKHWNNKGPKFVGCKAAWDRAKAEEQAGRAVETAERDEQIALRNAVIEREFKEQLARDLIPPSPEEYARILNTF